MKKTVAVAALVLLLAEQAPGADPPAKSKAHGFSVTGTVVSVDESAKKLLVKSAAGREVALSWTDATKTAGGSLKLGARITARYLQKDGKNIATSIQIAAEKPLGSPSPAPSGTPTAVPPVSAK